MTKELAYSLAAISKEASELYEKCLKTAGDVDSFFAASQDVQQHPMSKQNFAKWAKGSEEELSALLRELRELSTRGKAIWGDFVFLAGGENREASRATDWCLEHGVDGETVIQILENGAFILSDFGLTKESFRRENDRILAAYRSNDEERSIQD